MTNPIKMTQEQIERSEQAIRDDAGNDPYGLQAAAYLNAYRREHLIELVPDAEVTK